jgi:signal transduction histidine kinase
MAPWSLARKRCIALHANAEPVLVMGNRYAIGDAIRNLVENAVAHAPPLTEVTVITSADGTVSVADRGPGIIAEHRKQIFERFWRGTGKGGSGAGLGLAIVMEIMRAHEGSVRVDDNSGGGATFTLCFGHLAPPRTSAPQPRIASHNAN